MKREKSLYKIVGVVVLVALMLSSVATIALGRYSENMTSGPSTVEQGNLEMNTETLPESLDVVNYEGTVRVYVVEPTSRWNHNNGKPYQFGFLDFAIVDTVSIPPLGTYEQTIVWDASDNGWSGVSESNIMVMAAVFNAEPHTGYSYPPSGYPFTAYYVDATAAATPGTTGYNTVNEDFTHTVFVEEGTRTTCPYCPDTALALKTIYDSHDYPFYFVALVGDQNSLAYNRLDIDYNFYGYPTCYFDGGYRVLLGGYAQESYYRTRIEACGARVVPDLNLTLSLDWLGEDQLEIYVGITNNTGTIPGDLDLDCFVTVTDFTIFAAAYGSSLGDPNYNPLADMNDDGVVNVTDFTIFANWYGQNCGS